jgi:ferric-dicitrate binding protein FerR (iron transport regulator)
MELSKRELLKKFLNGAYTPEEWQEIQSLLRRPDAQQALEELTWQDWLQDEEPANSDERRLLRKWKRRLDAGSKHKIIALHPLRLAAVWIGILLITGVTFIGLHKNSRKPQGPVAWQRIVNPQGLPVRYILPDSSEVFLGAGSAITYPDGFGGSERRINLTGEAFFRVRHRAEKPFIVYTEDLRTTDIGTSFKIEAFAEKPITVTVATGKVSISSRDGGSSRQLALLTPGGKISWDRSAQKASLTQENVDNPGQWAAGALIFEKETLEDIARALERRFAVQITLADAGMAQYRVTGAFSASQTVGDILQMLSMLGKFHYESNGNNCFLITRKK